MDRIDQALATLWAKKNDRDGRLTWLPLTTHLEDTKGVITCLYQHWMSDGQKEILLHTIKPAVGTVDEALGRRLAQFLASVHDIGKATPVFQTQKGFQHAADLDDALVEHLEQSGFTGISKISLDNQDRKRTHHTVTGEYLLGQYGVRDDIASIIGAHHGKPLDDKKEVNDQRAYEDFYDQNENGDPSVIALWQAVQKEIFLRAMRTGEFTKPDRTADVALLPEITEPGQVILSGLVIMADWIASNEQYFPLIPIEEMTTGDMRQRLEKGWTQWYKHHADEPLTLSSTGKAEDYYTMRFGFTPRDFQRIVFDTITKTEDPGIFILEAPMGGGKTEAALAAVEQLMAATQLDGLFFGLPTQATSNGIFRRIETWYEQLVKDYDKRSTMKLMHGKAALNDLQEELSRGDHVDEDGGAGVFTSAWFSGRKTAILSDAVVGTVDHFLLTALKQRHLALRHLGFSRKIVVIDEVHAYDAYMDVYLARALEWMGAFGIPVVLLSATLPSEIRKRLVTAYLEGQDIWLEDMEARKCDQIFASEQYPLLTYTCGAHEALATENFAPVLQQEIHFPTEKNQQITFQSLDEEELYHTLQDFLDAGGVAGVLVNTVARAQEIYRRMIEFFPNEVSLFHAHFIDTDRAEKEKQLMHEIGKDATRPYRAIIIGTQVLEQSLDIDFDVLISDLCPMDLLLQRVGRLHRHNISRPRKLEEPKLLIMELSDTFDFEEGASAIYGKYLLARTQCVLEKQNGSILLPKDISPLVQRVYGDMPLQIKSSLQEIYKKAHKDYESVKEKKQNKAGDFLLRDPSFDWDPEECNLHGWLDTTARTDNEAMAYAQVRDAQESIEVIAVRQIGEGYGFFEGKEDISGQIENNKIMKELSSHTLKISHSIAVKGCGSISNTIAYLEEFNHGHLANWQKQPWLKGCLGIIFQMEDDGKTGWFKLKDATLYYDKDIGLRVEQVE